MFMTSSSSPLQRQGNFFILTDKEGNKKYYRLKGKDSSGEISLPATTEVAEHVFDVLKSVNLQSGETLNLADTIITHEGVQIIQKSASSLEHNRVRILSSDFDNKYATLTQLASASMPPLPSPTSDLPTSIPDIPVNPSNQIPLGQQGRDIHVNNSSDAASTSAFVLGKLKVPRLFLAIRNLFIKITDPAKYEREEISKIETFMTRSTEQISDLMNFQLEDLLKNDSASVAVDKQFVYVPQNLLKQEESTLDKQIVAEVMVGQKGTKYVTKDHRLYRNVESIITKSGIKVTGYKFKLDKENTEDRVVKNAVIPTVFTRAKKEKTNHLGNCYMTAHEEQGIIRHAVADTPEKVDELIAAARQLNQELGHPPPSQAKKLRIASHQLNTPTRKLMPADETKLVKNQHQSLAIGEKKAGDVEIAHINTPCNRAYNWGRIFEKIGLGYFFPGEAKSRVQNIEGLTTYLNWVVEDLDNLSNILSNEEKGEKKAVNQAIGLKLKLAVNKLQHGDKSDVTKMVEKKNQIRDKIVEMENENKIIKNSKNNLKNSGLSKEEIAEEKLKIQASEEKISVLGDEIAQLRRELTNLSDDRFTASMEAKYQALKEIEQSFSEDPALKEYKETIILMKKLIGDQLKKPEDRLLRGEQLMTYLLLDKKLEVISAMNCKSGLDRTGFVHAVCLAMLETPKDQLFEIVNNWDYRTAELNKKLKTVNYQIESLTDPQDQAILAFRQKVLTNLLKVSLKITVTSTGLIGLKWSKGISANLIPLNFIPPKVKVVNQDGTIREEQILFYDNHGDPEGLTETGHQILTQLSDQRGA
jgi:DNA-binding transcriptional regulator YiaG